MRALYTIHVRRQNGVWQTERKVRPGRLPKEGETVSTTLGTEVVKARVLNVIEERRELLYEVFMRPKSDARRPPLPAALVG